MQVVQYPGSPELPEWAGAGAGSVRWVHNAERVVMDQSSSFVSVNTLAPGPCGLVIPGALMLSTGRHNRVYSECFDTSCSRAGQTPIGDLGDELIQGPRDGLWSGSLLRSRFLVTGMRRRRVLRTDSPYRTETQVPFQKIQGEPAVSPGHPSLARGEPKFPAHHVSSTSSIGSLMTSGPTSFLTLYWRDEGPRTSTSTGLLGIS
jgi:hypothetical protein